MNRLSSIDPVRQQANAIHADIAFEFGAGNPLPVLDDDFDYDGDTALDDGGDDPEPNSGACGLPCTKGDGKRKPGAANWSLCAVVIEPDPSCPDDPEYIAAGQQLCKMFTRTLAVAACDGYALSREHLERTFGIGVPGCTHLVVNDRHGAEVHRRPILSAA